jgi:hypothetical protein
VGGTLTISPFYQFNIGELSPKEQSTNWFRPAGQATFSLSNRGNSTTLFQLEGVDTQQGCSFEFDIPGETTSLATRVELRLPPEETVAIPIQIIPHSRSLFLRGLNYSYTITALTLEGVHTPLSILGQLKTKPLIRLWHVILFMLFTMVLLSYIFRPQARELKVNGQIVSQEVKVGTPVTLSWEASRFAVVRVECKAAGECPPASILDQPVGQMVIEPTADAIYVLQARNLLSEVPIVGPALFQPSKESPLVIVTPVRPLIQDFSVNTDTILSGQPVTLRWEVDNADEVILRTNDAPEALATAQHIGQKTESLEADTVYILEAKNSYGPDTKNLRVKVSTPTPTLTPFPPTATPIPTPFVKTFFADRDTINPGDNVTISWEVIGADIVSVQPIGNEVPPVQTLSQSPQESTIYTLSASNGPVRIEPRTIEVKVNTPTPAPEQPIIQVFTASESEVTKGDNTGVLLSWSITGNPETIELVGPNGLALPILEAQSSLSVTVNDSASFILTALTENLKDSKAVQINGIDPTPTPTPTPPPLPEANIELFQISQPVGPQVIDLGGSNPHRYQVQVNTTVTFLWQVNSAAVQAILTEDGVTPISQGVPFMMHNVIISKAGSFVLTAENAEGQRDQRTISIEITDQLPPHPPFNVAVEEDVAGNQNILTWDWTFNPARSNIVGFRVYRLDDPNGNATRIADESILTVEATKRYIDQVNPTCGRAYYVRAVYRDISGQLQESGASTNTWYTGQC